MITISMKMWNKIRDRFSESEKIELRAAIRSHIICPAGYIIDEKTLNESTETKLRDEMEQALLKEVRLAQ